MAENWLDLARIKEHSLDMRQFMDFRESTIANGMRIIEAYNSSGLTFTLLPDRGMDIWAAHYNGMPLTWIAPSSPHPPDYGQSWLSLFNGGLLTTCGLTHVGTAEDGRDIHGNYTRLRAENIRKEQGKRVLRLYSTINESTLFGEQLEVKRTYTLPLGMPKIELYDEVTNIGDKPIPFMMLYHCNVGYPMVREGTELIVESDIYPRDAVAKTGVQTWNTYEGASPSYQEQVFFHHVRYIKGERKDFADATLRNEDIALSFAWNTRYMPYLSQWKNTRQGIYVCGIEPGNCIPEGQNAAKESGRLVMLNPSETHYFNLLIEIQLNEDLINTRRMNLREYGKPIENCNLSDYSMYLRE